jgi:hypothetical protein
VLALTAAFDSEPAGQHLHPPRLPRGARALGARGAAERQTKFSRCDRTVTHIAARNRGGGATLDTAPGIELGGRAISGEIVMD